MVRCDIEIIDELSALPGASVLLAGRDRPVKGWLFIDSVGTSRQSDLIHWLTIALSATGRVKVAQKRRR